MMNKINCFITYNTPELWEETLAELCASDLVNRVYLLGKEQTGTVPEGCGFIKTDGRFSTGTVKKIADYSNGAAYALVITREVKIRFGMLALERFLELASGSGSAMLYSDFFDRIDGKLSAHPVIDYQSGSLRDDFEFGPVLFFNSQVLIQAAGAISEALAFAGLYQLRLKVSQAGMPLRIPEYLYVVEPLDTRISGKKIFDYVDPKNREVQLEMEKAATVHLKEIGGYLEPEFEPISFDEDKYPVEASVIIPVLNREKTVADAIESVMLQETDFDFNLILVDNHSTDRTTSIVKELAKKHDRLIHVIPERYDLGIGG
ncbi:MAG: glycosyltransferase, partial [Bacteroidota bacterium]|nr:glycosyltransferase [Bacteroidota bacterium]